MPIFDAHCHLQDSRLLPRLEQALHAAHHVGVQRLACCGTNEDDWETVLELARRYPGQVVPSFGLHPWYVEDRSESWLETLEAYLHRLPSGVGEIGLDHGLRDRDDEIQEEVFLRQLDLACRLERPMSIHCRRAFGRLLELLEPRGPVEAGFVIHSYSGSRDLIERFERLGGYFSFSGTLTLTRNKRAHRNVVAVPSSRLLVETDAPDMAPLIDGARSCEPNLPENIVHVLAKAANLLETTPEEVARRTWVNCCQLFAPILPPSEEELA